ncbi:MAG: pyridoxamine 5'-phosphate oxidase family protein [archaeon]
MKITKQLKKLIEENALALASVDEKGNPHNIALGYVKVIEGNKILISVNYIVFTLKYIKKNPNVSLVVWNKNWKKNCIGYELLGKAKFYSKGKYSEIIKKLPINKGEPCRGAIIVSINKIKNLS